jgi:DNA-binding GntR family transcriptional regulator
MLTATEDEAELLTQKVASLIRDMIVQDLLPPGTRLRERMLMIKLSDQITLSRTPLREALKMLASEGLVRLMPNKGAVVADPDVIDITEMQLILATLEGLAGELAAVRATDEEIGEIAATHYEMIAAFHRKDRLSYFKANQQIHAKIVSASRNNVLIDDHNRLNRRLYRVRYQGNLRNQDWMGAIQEHELILNALQSRNGEKLGALMREHFGSRAELMARSNRAAVDVPVPIDSEPEKMHAK